MTTHTTTHAGRLTPDRFGFSMPADAPLYPPLPWRYGRARFLTISYETDPEAAADSLPEGLTFAEPATVRITFATYLETPVGPYKELMQGLECAWDGDAMAFIGKIVLDNDAALAAGREALGYPKKLASVTWSERGREIEVAVERRGALIARVRASAGMVTAVNAEAPVHTASLRLLPPAEVGAAPSIAELLHVPATIFIHETAAADATLEFGPGADTEAWSALPVRRVLGATLAVGDLTLPFGRVLKRYDHP